MQENMSCEDALEKPKPATENLPVVLVAAAALIDPDGRVLIARRPEGKSMAGLWEFPGGKVHAGETPEYALMRELEEELGIETRPCCFSPVAFASHSYDNFHLLMPLFVCRVWKGVPQAREHKALKWVRPGDLYEYPMPAADLPLIGSLKSLL
jgi:8-oxo-dGTP diphosphatase